MKKNPIKKNPMKEESNKEESDEEESNKEESDEEESDEEGSNEEEITEFESEKQENNKEINKKNDYIKDLLFSADDFFNDNSVITLEESDIIDDSLFTIELENALLKQLPFSKQNNKLFQDLIQYKTRIFVELNKLALKQPVHKCEALRNNVLNSVFPSFIIPITYDTKRIYKLDDDSNIENNIICEECDKDGIFLKDDIKEEQYLQKNRK